MREHRHMEPPLAQATVDCPTRLAAGNAIAEIKSGRAVLNILHQHRGPMVSPPLLDHPVGPICAHGRVWRHQDARVSWVERLIIGLQKRWHGQRGSSQTAPSPRDRP